MKTSTRLSLLATLALLLALCLMASAGPASASTTNTITWALMGQLDPGIDLPPGDDGTYYGENWVAYALVYRASGPDGLRFLGYGVVCLDVVGPPKGNNYHKGEVAFVGKDPSSVPWDTGRTFLENLVPHGLLWTGTWDGFTRNKYNHHGLMALTGWPGSYNGGYTAIVEMHCGLFDVAWRAGKNYVTTPWNGVVRVDEP